MSSSTKHVGQPLAATQEQLPRQSSDPDDNKMIQAIDEWVAAACGPPRVAQMSSSTKHVGQPLAATQEQASTNNIYLRQAVGESVAVASPDSVMRTQPTLPGAAQTLSGKQLQEFNGSAAASQRERADTHREWLDLKYKKRAWKRLRKSQGLSEEYPPDLAERSWHELLSRDVPGSASTSQPMR